MRGCEQQMTPFFSTQHRRMRLKPGNLLFLLFALALTILFVAPNPADAQWFPFRRAEHGYDRCIELYESRQFDDARVCIREFLSGYPNSRWVEQLQYLDAKLETGVYEAQEKLTEFLREFPDGQYSDDANFGLGQLWQLTGDYERAHEYYLRMYERFPESDLRNEATLNAAKCLLLSGDPRSAALSLVAYLATAPEQPWRSRAEELHADALFDEGRYEQAQHEYREIISRAPSPQSASPESYLKVAGIYELMENREASLRAYGRFLNIFPETFLRPEIEKKMADLAAHLRVDLSINSRPHIIEAGAFNSRQEAMRLIARLNRLGFRAYVVRRNMGAENILSVRLGPYDSRDSALATADRLMEEAKIEVKLLPQGGQL